MSTAGFALGPRYRTWLLDAFGPAVHGRVLEVGAGAGDFSAALLEREGVDRVVAIESDPECFRHLEERFAGEPSVRVRQATIDAVESELDAFDCAVCIGRPNLAAELPAIAVRIDPGGSICVATSARGVADNALCDAGLEIVSTQHIDRLSITGMLRADGVLEAAIVVVAQLLDMLLPFSIGRTYVVVATKPAVHVPAIDPPGASTYHRGIVPTVPEPKEH